MIYKFKSKACGDLIMLGPHGDALLRAWGRDPSAKGIVQVADIGQTIAATERALAEDAATSTAKAPGVSMRQRLWPMLEMLRRADAARQPIVWGV